VAGSGEQRGGLPGGEPGSVAEQDAHGNLLLVYAISIRYKQ
jgi:hypothetical protein